MNHHPIADLFPLLCAEEIQALADDIRANGLREAIALLNGEILDGRNRLRACEIAGIEPKFVDLAPGTDAVALVVSKNLRRRNLNVSQRASIGARLANCREGRPSKSASAAAVSENKAAEMVGVSRAALQRGKRVLAHGTRELVAQLADGKISLSRAATLAGLPAADQRAALGSESAKRGKGQSRKPTEAPSSAADQARPPTVRDGPPVIRTYAARLREVIRPELDHIRAHELHSAISWTASERSEAAEILRGLRDEIAALLDAVEQQHE